MGLLVALLVAAPLGALACLALGDERRAGAVSLAASGLVAGLGVALAAAVARGGPVAGPGGWWRADALSALLVLTLGVVAFASAWYAHGYMPHVASAQDASGWPPGRYHALYLALVASLVAAALADNLGAMWIALEASTLASAVLVGYYRRPGAVEAGWKYLVLCSVGITLALLGTVLVYASSAGLFADHASGLRWSALELVAPQLEPRFVKLAFLFALVGYGTKAGLAPMHAWLPDAHSQAPTPVSALLSGALLAVALAAVFRFHAVASGCVGPGWSSGLLVIFGLLSMAVATPFILLSGDYKRLLAWSSVEHTGFVALAIGLGAPLAVFGGLLHVLAQALAKTLAFLAGGTLAAAFRSRRLDHWSGVLEAAPATGALFVVAGAGLAGLPPLALFLSEWLTLTGGLQAGRAGVVAAAAALLVLAFAGLAYHWSRVALGRAHDGYADPLPASSRAPMWLLAGLLLLLGVWLPPPLRSLLEQAAGVLGGR